MLIYSFGVTTLAEPVEPFTPFSIQLNCGGINPVTSADGVVWEADRPSAYYKSASNNYSNGSEVERSQIDGDRYPPELFNVNRWRSGNMVFEFPVDPGRYRINILQAEVWSGASTPGSRVFSIAINDVTQFQDVDLASLFGFRTAGILSHEFDATDLIKVEFIKQIENPQVSAIEITKIR